jgi:two-component system, NtrC family, sensor kinase
MTRRSGAGPERAKSHRRKTVTQKRRGLRNPSAADHKTQSEVAQLIRERDEALEREKATAEVLRVISSSPGEIERAFDAMLANATHICEASHGTLWLYEGDARFRAVAVHGELPAAYVEQRHSRMLFKPGAEVPIARAVRTRSSVHITDLRKDRSYLDGETSCQLSRLTWSPTVWRSLLQLAVELPVTRRINFVASIVRRTLLL